MTSTYTLQLIQGRESLLIKSFYLKIIDIGSFSGYSILSYLVFGDQFIFITYRVGCLIYLTFYFFEEKLNNGKKNSVYKKLSCSNSLVSSLR